MMELHITDSSSDNSNNRRRHHHQTSLSSQRSLASVPSLNSRSNYPPTTAQHHCLTTFKGAHDASYTSSLTVSGKFLYAGSSNTQISSFNRTQLLSPQQPATVVAGKGAVKSLVIHHDKLFSAHQDNKIRVWKISSGGGGTTTHHDQQRYTHLATLPTLSDRVSKLLLPNSRVQIRRHKKCTWVHHVDAVSSLAVSHDGALLYSVSWDRTIKVWRTKDFACLESVANAHDDAINAVAVSGHDGRVYTGSADKRIKVWKGLGEKKKKKKQREKHCSLVETLEKHKSGINALALSSDGSVLYSGACDRSILVWEGGEEGKMVVVGALRGHARSILSLVVVLDLVCSGSEDKTVRLWRGLVNSDNKREYSCMAVLDGHRGPIKSLAAMVDQHCEYNTSDEETSIVVYSGSLDGDVKVWQVCVPALDSDKAS